MAGRLLRATNQAQIDHPRLEFIQMSESDQVLVDLRRSIN